MDALQGKVSGVQIASAGGPGAPPKVIIRGITSVNGYWDKLNLRLNTKYNFTDWLKVGLDLAPNMENWDDTPNLFGAAQSMDPTTPVFRPEDQWDLENPMNNYQRSYNNQEWNPAGNLARMDSKTRKFQLLANPFIEIRPIKQLILRTQFGLNFWMQRNDWYNCAFHIADLEKRDKDEVGRKYSDGLNWTWNNTITYTDTYADKHNLTVMAGFTAERYADWWLEGSRQDVPGSSDLLHEVSAGTGDQKAGGNMSYQTLASFLGRVMYNYDSRYYLTASIRADGSSRFPKGNKFGYFPSVSLAWRLSNEKFMEATQGWLSNAKIRLGWGRVGNQAIANGAYMTKLNNGVNYVFGPDGTRYPATILGDMGNPNLKWETVEDIDFGIDLGFFNDRLGVTFDLYKKTSHDMLYGKQSQLIMGVPTWMGAITQNIGKMRARGWELAINWNDRAEAFLVNGTYNWDKCAGQRYFMDQAKQMGVESFVLFSNSPLVQWTLNGQGRSDSRWEANLKEDWMDKAFMSKGIPTKILVPEAAAWNYLYEYDNNNRGRTNQIQELFDPASENYIGDLGSVDKVVAGHSYWSFDNWESMRDVRKRVSDAASAKNLRVWQTEWSMLDKEPSELGGTYDNVSEFDISQYMSRVIHNDIVMAGCTSWCYWTAMSVERYSQKNRFELIKTTPAGGNYSNDFTSAGNVDATHNLWVLGNYSRFIRPGYIRIGLKANEDKDFFGTAYVSPDGKTVVAVYTNYDKEKGVTLTNSFDNGKTPKTVTRYTTTATRHLEEDRFNVADNVFLEPASVTTVVYTFE